MLDVPLDYLNPKLGRAYVPIIKKPATSPTTYKGILFVNPGGPGESGVKFLLSRNPYVDLVAGSDYDLASWEPRGIGYSVPAVNSCSAPTNATSTSEAKLRRDLEDLKIHGPNLPQEVIADADTYTELTASCVETMGGNLDAGPHMTTATVVRDLLSILDAYSVTPEGCKAEDPELLNLWGFSYGSIIGQTFASMFPERVGRVVVDGVVDPDEYAAGTIDSLSNIDMDAVMATFFVYCYAAGPSQCPFSIGASAYDIYHRFETMINHLNVTQAVQQKWENATAIGSTIQTMQSGLFGALSDPPEYFPRLSIALVAIESFALSGKIASDSVAAIKTALLGDGNAVLPPGDPTPELQQIRLAAVGCSDTGGKLYTTSFSEYAARLPILQERSWIGGDSAWVNYLPCMSWSIKSEDVYLGPFGGEVKGRFLAVGNRFDPQTPLVNAVKAARIFPQAELLTIEGTGHTSLSAVNECAFRKINAFFYEDESCQKETYCPLEAGPWNITLAGPLEKIDGLEGIVKRFQGMKVRE
ncbi:hypothetical protein VTL71DRAFT_13451 [Oculimacula yallundae]|uniref:Peptidase S33 tripeptidyl aminopeptidase-like C-terminal domain-containing protein n=1 Tax=Oculimacula yallundae TaxID=86028 RepID=A0ABR4CKG8_9HELO